MNLSNRVSGSFILAAVLSVSLFLSGCEKVREFFGSAAAHDHNLRYVTCDNATVDVNSSTGTSDVDEMVFLCPGKNQTLTWQDPSGSSDFSVDFGAESPFANLVYTSSNKKIGPLKTSGPSLGGQRAKVFKYKLTVQGASKPFDPHVIIMGGS